MTNRISTKRLKAEITRVNDARKYGIGLPVWPDNPPRDSSVEVREKWWAEFEAAKKAEQRTTAYYATLLYSLRSHLRNRLHITHQYVQESKSGPGKWCGETHYIRYDRTMEDQAKLIANIMEEFRMTDEEQAADEASRALRLVMNQERLAMNQAFRTKFV